MEGSLYLMRGTVAVKVTEYFRTLMSVCHRSQLRVVAVLCFIVLLTSYLVMFHNVSGEQPTEVFMAPRLRSALPSHLPPPGPCTCPKGSFVLKTYIPENQYEELLQRRAKEFQKYKARTSSVLSRLLFALPNSPLRYPIQGYTVRPLTTTLIPGLGLHAGQRNNYKVSLSVSKGILTTETPAEGATVKGAGETELILESSSLVILNNLLAKVSYTSTIYHINTGDLASFQFEDHEAVFPIAIKQPHLPVLYDMGTDISSQVTITTKTFLRYEKLKVLIDSIRRFYSNITVIIADDSLEPENITGENIQHYIMPPAQGWFAGRNLAVSQVTTKYFVWVDDDFLFTKNTKLEKFVEVMEAIPELDMVGGSVKGGQFHFSLEYEEGEEEDGGCLYRKTKKFHPLPGYPQCSLASGVVNFFIARTDSVLKVGFDPKLSRVAHSEFFMDGLGSLLVATCSHVSIDHQPKTVKNEDPRYRRFRSPRKDDTTHKLQLHFFKNHLKCIRYG